MQPHDNSNSNPEYQHKHRNGLLSIKTKDLTFGFEASTKTIIDKININLSNARSVGVIGENGSGKTTLSQLISNSIKPSSGSIELDISNNIPSIGVLNQFPERMLGSNTLEHLLLKLINNNKFDPNILNSFILLTTLELCPNIVSGTCVV